MFVGIKMTRRATYEVCDKCHVYSIITIIAHKCKQWRQSLVLGLNDSRIIIIILYRRMRMAYGGLIKAVKESIHIPLIVGGGLTSTDAIKKAYEAGADIVVVGNYLETHLEKMVDFCDVRNWIIKAE